jgi:threonine/homoserine/homoserine lactone efflux protein
MEHLAFLFWSSFLVAFSGAMMPGPMLTATVSEVMKRGFVAGPLIVLGHGLLELGVLFGVVAGLGEWIVRDTVLGGLSVVGGLLLVVLGVMTVAGSGRSAQRDLQDEADPRTAVRGPILAGILTSLSNPYWTLWWATIGLGYAAVSLKSGVLGLTSFYTGHILADLAWYCLVAGAVASGRRVCSPSMYRVILILCGLALVGLGTWFLFAGIGRWA